MHTGCRWTGRLDGDVCFELRLPRADFRREQAGSVSTVAPTDDNIFVHRTCFHFTCCTTDLLVPCNLQEYPWVHGIITRPPTIPFLFFYSIRDWFSFFSSLLLSLSFSFFWFRRSINQRIRGGNERISATMTVATSYRVCIKNAYVREFFDLGIPPVVKVWLLP